MCFQSWSLHAPLQTSEDILAHMGMHASIPHHLTATAVALALICTLFMGSFVGDGLLAWTTVKHQLHNRNAAPGTLVMATLHAATLRILPVQALSNPATAHVPLRNVVFAPIAEEIVFRGVLGAWLLAAGVRPALAMTLAPLTFAAAHAHHAWQQWRGGAALTRVLLSGTVTLAYTWVFGMIAWWLLLRTGSLAAAVAAHSLCNCLGVPNVGFFSQRNPVYWARFGALPCAWRRPATLAHSSPLSSQYSLGYM